MGYMPTCSVWQILFPECDELLISTPVLIKRNRMGGRITLEREILMTVMNMFYASFSFCSQ